MNNKHLILGGLIVLILCFFGYKSYQSIEKQNAKYGNQKSAREIFNEQIEKNTLNEKQALDEVSFDKPIFKFTSNSNDLENETDILQTNEELSYHTFDFNKNIISFKSKEKNGSWKTFEFKIKESYTMESLLGFKGMEFDIDHPVCFQVWVSSLGNIGYELKNGQKLVFYGVEEI